MCHIPKVYENKLGTNLHNFQFKGYIVKKLPIYAHTPHKLSRFKKIGLTPVKINDENNFAAAK